MLLISLIATAASAYALDPYTLGRSAGERQASLANLLHSGTGSRIALWQAQNARLDDPHQSSSQQVYFGTSKTRDPWTTEPDHPVKYAEHCFEQPLDHMDPDNRETLCQRYWVSLEHYDGDKRGTEPVYLLDGGETSGANVSRSSGEVG